MYLNQYYCFQNLLALRAQDKKSNKRVKAMINMSKGASKAVLEDAKVCIMCYHNVAFLSMLQLGGIL